jgi:hypothetical protein
MRPTMVKYSKATNQTPRVELPPRLSQRLRKRDPQRLTSLVTSVTSPQRESANTQLSPRIAPPKYRVEKPGPPSSSKAFRNKLISTPFSTLTEGQRLVWNPKYHSIDESRAKEGFYGVKNALGPGGRTLFISCLEAEVQCITFGAFWTMNPSSYGSIAMAIVTGGEYVSGISTGDRLQHLLNPCSKVSLHVFEISAAKVSPFQTRYTDFPSGHDQHSKGYPRT